MLSLPETPDAHVLVSRRAEYLLATRVDPASYMTDGC